MRSLRMERSLQQPGSASGPRRKNTSVNRLRHSCDWCDSWAKENAAVPTNDTNENLALLLNLEIGPAERPKLSDPARGRHGLQPERDGRFRCSAWVLGEHPISRSRSPAYCPTICQLKHFLSSWYWCSCLVAAAFSGADGGADDRTVAEPAPAGGRPRIPNGQPSAHATLSPP